jgi:branched-chain amino acid transport system permease protein
MVLALSWDMLIRSGQLSFGLAGFFGLGTYAAVLSVLKLSFPPIVSILFAGIFAAFVAFLLGLIILRLRGMYFAITTLALAEIFKIIIRNWTSFTGGPEGELLPNVIFGGSSTQMFWLSLAVLGATAVMSEMFNRSKIHFALTAIRNNEIVAKSRGINIYRYLIIAFVITSAFQGLIGGTYAQMYGFVTPDSSFNTNFTLLPLAMALLGGMYSTLGPIIGALLLGIVSEYLKLYIPYGHLVVYGIIIVVVILFMPQGIVGIVRNKIGRR